MATRLAPPTTGAPTTSPYAQGQPEVFVTQRLDQARAAIAAGTTPTSVERELFDQFVANPKARPAPTSRNPVPLMAAAAAIVFAVVVGFAGFLWLVDDPLLTGMLPGAERPTSRPTSTPRQSLTPRPTATAAQAPETTIATGPVATPYLTLAPRATATIAPTPEPTPSMPPVDRLAALIPQDIRSSCEAIAGNLPGEALSGMRCLGLDDPDTQVSYFLYDDSTALNEAFAAARQPAGVTEYGNACWAGGQGQYTQYWLGEADDPAGYVACYTVQDRAVVLWTRYDDGVMARAARTTNEVSELMDWWSTGAPGPL